MSAGAWFFVACAIAALVCAAVGAAIALRAAAALKRHANAIVPEELIAKARTTQAAITRLQSSLTASESLLPRAVAAVDRIERSVRVLRVVFSLKR